MIKELKNFLMKGNLLELAIAVIVAGAFGAVVASFTQDIVMPPLGLLVGGIDFSDLKWVLKAVEGDAPEVAINYGKFIKFMIDFIIIAIVLFYVVKAYNKATQSFKKEEEAAAPAGPSDNDLLKEIRDLLKK
jgi:large conductance mechanosensitive channel